MTVLLPVLFKFNGTYHTGNLLSSFQRVGAGVTLSTVVI